MPGLVEFDPLTGVPVESAAPVGPDVTPDGGGLLGEVATGVLGAGRTATWGLTDDLLAAGATIYGGEKARHKVQETLKQAKEANPYSDMAGEAAGLFVAGGGGISDLGEAVEGAVEGGLGEGLYGKVAGMAARGGMEAGAMGAQHVISEAQLGDHEVNAEKLVAEAGKEVLFGAGVGGVLGAAAHGIGSLLARGPGPTAGRLLDEVAGVEGAGARLKAEAAGAEELVNEARAAGATSEQAAKLTDEMTTAGQGRAGMDPSLVDHYDDQVANLIKRRANGNAELESTLTEAYSRASKGAVDHDGVLNANARNLAEKGNSVFRNLEDTASEVHFRERPEQIAKLMDGVDANKAADAVAVMGQEVQGKLDWLNSLVGKGGSEGAVDKLGKAMQRHRQDLVTLVEGGENAGRDAYMSAYRLKQEVGKHVPFGTLPERMTEAQRELHGLYETLRVGLEDSTVFGRAGDATREMNEAFTSMKPRRDAFGNAFAVNIDRGAGGVRMPEIDAGKMKSMLRQLGGAESDQAVKTIESTMTGWRNWADSVEKYGDLTAAQRSKLVEGRKALKDFEVAFRDAQKETAVVNRIEAQRLAEAGSSMGGLLGLVGDVVTKPLTTVERLASIRATAEKVEKGFHAGLEKFFGGKGEKVVEKAVRPKADVIKEIGDVRSISGNMDALQARARSLVGDLGQYAPKHADAATAVATRALTFLAMEAPKPTGKPGITGVTKYEPRYSDQQIHEYETKRQAIANPKAVVDDMHSGRINREAIRAIKFVYPRMFQQLQVDTQEWLARLDRRGDLDKMPYSQKAVLATLLEVPADGTWEPDFMLMMQAAKAPVQMQQQQQAPQAAPQGGTSKRAIQMNTKLYATEAEQIASGGKAA